RADQARHAAGSAVGDGVVLDPAELTVSLGARTQPEALTVRARARVAPPPKRDGRHRGSASQRCDTNALHLDLPVPARRTMDVAAFLHCALLWRDLAGGRDCPARPWSAIRAEMRSLVYVWNRPGRRELRGDA